MVKSRAEWTEKTSPEVLRTAMNDRGSKRLLQSWLVGGTLALLLCFAALAPVRAEGVVRGLYFYSPTCSHCQAIAKEVLPAIQERFGSKLEWRMFAVSQPQNLE